MNQSRFLSVGPIIPVRDLDAALARYGALGFTANHYDGPERYEFVERGGASDRYTKSRSETCGTLGETLRGVLSILRFPSPQVAATGH